MKKTNKIHCRRVTISAERLKMLSSSMPGEDFFVDMTELFKILGDPTRAKILYCLQSDDMCVCEIAETLGLSHSAVSHQLRILRAGRIVRSHRQGRLAVYSLADGHVRQLLKMAGDHVGE